MSLLEGHLNIEPTKISGGELAVSDGNALLPTGAVGGPEVSGGGSNQIYTYIVRDGDTLSAIAHMFGVSINTIIWANDLNGSRISPGQTLVILPISGVKHIVVKGDTLQSIAKKYKADMGDILVYNGLSSNSSLAIGDEIIIPDGEIASVSSGSIVPINYAVQVASGYYLRPVDGGRKTQGIHGHNGVDLGGLPIGTPVHAAADGTVIVARTTGYNGGYGLYIVVSHSNGTQTLYAHLSEVGVVVGENVQQGNIIGKIGYSGHVIPAGPLGAHLHFEVRGARNPF